MEIGYTNDLLILPFDHRGTFGDKMFKAKGRDLTADEIAKISEFKEIIYDAFLLDLQRGVPKEKAGILIDEQFGDAVLRRAKEDGIAFALTIEKSGQEEFDFEYGDRFGEHIEKYDAPIAKVLVRYNVEGDKEANARQLIRLKKLGDYLKANGRKFLFEMLVLPTARQLAQFGGDKRKYDVELRPKLMVLGINEIQKAHIAPDIWKLEGLERTIDVAQVVKACKSNGTDAGVIILGRGETSEKVKEWLLASANVPGVIGFAIGRTVFWEPLAKYYEKKISRKDAVEKIAKNYKEFVDLWFDARK